MASAIILAGGQSRRMGQPKVALRFGTSTILERIIAELRRAFDDILVMAAPSQNEAFAIDEIVGTSDGPVRLLHDATAYEGPATALARGLNAARHNTAFACSGDLPLLRVDVAKALCEMIDDYEAVVPQIGGIAQPLCAAYRRGVRSSIEAQVARAERRLTRITEGLNAYHPGEAEMRRFDPELRSFINVNTPEDYARVMAMATDIRH